MVFMLSPNLVHAHILPGEQNGLIAGFSHPLHGLDHILAMIAVGLWAAQMGGRALWFIPTAFVSLMALGGLLRTAGVTFGFVEQGILLSVVVLGGLIASTARLPLSLSATLVGSFALFHGYAHGAEMPATASGLAFAAGFLLATVLLHACGLGAGLLVQKTLKLLLIRVAGAAIAVAGLSLWFA